MEDLTTHKWARGLAIFVVLMVIFSLDIGNKFSYSLLGYAVSAAVAILLVYLVIKIVDSFFSKNTK